MKKLTLQEEIEVIDRCDTAVDDCSGFWVAVTVRVGTFRRIETRVVTFSLFIFQYYVWQVSAKINYTHADNDGNLRAIWTLGCVESLARTPDSGQLFFDDNSKLTLRY